MTGGEIDIAGHSISAGAGAALTLVLDRVVKFFTERDRRADEIKIAERLAKIQTQLDQLLTEAKDRAALTSRIAVLESRIETLEGR